MSYLTILSECLQSLINTQMGNQQNNRINNHRKVRASREKSSYRSKASNYHGQNQSLHDSFIIRKSGSFYSSDTYPNFQEFQQKQQYLKDKFQGEKIQTSKVEYFPYNTVGFIAYQNAKGQRNYSTGFLITSCLVLTAANPTLVRNQKDGSICEYKPTYFLLGQGLNIKICEIVDYRRPQDYSQIINSQNAQDYLHSSIKSRIHNLIKAENYDFCLIKLKENIPYTNYLHFLGDYDGCRQNKIIGYNYRDQFNDLVEQDKQMIIGQYVYRNFYVCEDQKVRMDINVRKTVAGGPIIIKYQEKDVVIGILIRSSIHQKLSAGLLINNAKMQIIKNWIIHMNQFPKCLIFRNNRPSLDDMASGKDSSELNESSNHKPGKSQIFVQPQIQQNGQFWSKDNVNYQKFQITNTLVKKIKSNGEIHQIVSKNPVNIQKISSCKIKITQYGGKYAISIGLISQNRINKRYSGDYNQSQSIGFWTFNYGRGKGRMFVGGQAVRGWDQSLFINQGEHLIIKINKEQETTQWWINEREVAKFQLPGCLKNQDLYIYVAMQRKKDCIQYIK